MADDSFPGLVELASHLRLLLVRKKIVLLYAYNSTGKTRLSVEFKNLGKHGDERDTLYFNAFTEDLFSWDNDLENDRERRLKLNQDSRFFAGLAELEMETRIRPLLNRYADFDFRIDTTEWTVSFSREVKSGETTSTVDNIKVSRGEENIFIWCFFLAIVQLVLDGAEAYRWVKYVYIDDPVSSLDENNAVAVANHLAQLLTRSDNCPFVVVSTHHVLFFNVLCNEFKRRAHRLFLKRGTVPDSFSVLDTTSKPFLHHLSTLAELNEAQETGALCTHHFNMLRRVMEQTASFLGLSDWKACIPAADDDPDRTLHTRMVDLMSHGDYSLYEPQAMMPENKGHFRAIFRLFIANHPFNPALFQHETV
jgi:hypothetical protein